jgi:hypothetical protein
LKFLSFEYFLHIALLVSFKGIESGVDVFALTISIKSLSISTSLIFRLAASTYDKDVEQRKQKKSLTTSKFV